MDGADVSGVAATVTNLHNIGRKGFYLIRYQTLIELTIISSSLYFLRFGEMSIYIFDIFFLFLTISYFRRGGGLKASIIVAFFAFIISILIGAINLSIDFPVSIKDLIAPIIRYGQVVLFIAILKNHSKTRIAEPTKLRGVAFLTILLPLIIGLFLYHLGSEYVIVFNRYSSYLSNPNFLAAYVVAITPAAFSCSDSLGTLRAWMFKFVLLSTSAYSLVLSGSNSGTLLFLIVFVLNFVASLPAAIALASFVFVSWAFWTTVSEQLFLIAVYLTNLDFSGLHRSGLLLQSLLLQSDTSELGSAVFRKEVQQHLVSEYLSSNTRLFFGLGLGNSKFFSLETFGGTVTVHNSYLAILLEMGIAGVTAFLSLFYFVFRDIHWNRPQVMLVSGYLIASVSTPALYLPFFWVPIVSLLLFLPPAHNKSLY